MGTILKTFFVIQVLGKTVLWFAHGSEHQTIQKTESQIFKTEVGSRLMSGTVAVRYFASRRA